MVVMMVVLVTVFVSAHERTLVTVNDQLLPQQWRGAAVGAAGAQHPAQSLRYGV
jgi:hypothetical protein